MRSVLVVLGLVLMSLPARAADYSIQVQARVANIVLEKGELPDPSPAQITALFCRAWGGNPEIEYPVTYRVKRWESSGSAFVPGPVILTGRIERCEAPVSEKKPTF